MRGAKASIFLVFLAAGCNNTARMEIPKVSAPPKPTSAQTGPLFSNKDQATLRLEKLIADIKRGEVIAQFPAPSEMKEGMRDNCNSLTNIAHKDDALEWGTGQAEFGNWSGELGKEFHDVMSRAGYQVKGDTRQLFETSANARNVDYLVGGRITSIKGNICHVHSWNDGSPQYLYRGEFYMKVEWQVYSTFSRQVVLKFDTEGYGETTRNARQGIIVTLK